MTVLTLHYSTDLGARDLSLSRREVREQAAVLMPLIVAGRVWDVAVLDEQGADVTASFPNFT